MKSNRLNWIDILKGIGIIFVIIGHIFRDEMLNSYLIFNIIYKYIYSFHMGIFFFTSGYIYEYLKEKKDSLFIIKKFKSLIIPWIAYTVVLYIAFKVVFSLSIGESLNIKNVNLLEYIFECIIGKNPFSFHLWFLLIMFIVQLITYFVDNLFNNDKNKLIFLFISIIISFISDKVFIIHAISYFTIFYICGLLYCKYKKKSYKCSNKKNIFLYLLLISSSIVFILLLEEIIMNNYILFCLKHIRLYILSLLMIFILVILAQSISVNKKIEYLGKNSYNIYYLHQPLCCAVIGEIMLHYMHISYLNSIIIMVVCFLSSILIPLFITYITSKFKLNKTIYNFFRIKYIPYNKSEDIRGA